MHFWKLPTASADMGGWAYCGPTPKLCLEIEHRLKPNIMNKRKNSLGWDVNLREKSVEVGDPPTVLPSWTEMHYLIGLCNLSVFFGFPHMHSYADHICIRETLNATFLTELLQG